MNVKINVSGFAKVWDVRQIMILKLNSRENWAKGFAVPGRETEEVEIAESFANQFVMPNDRLKLFFDVEYKKNSFMSSYLREECCGCSISNVEELIQRIRADRDFKGKVLEFYLEEKFSSDQEALKRITFDAVKLKSDYKEKMMQFILFYEEYLNELFETMIGIQKQLEEIYQKNESLLKQLEKQFDIDWLVGNHKGIAKWCKSLAQIDVSFSFIQRHLLLGETYTYDQDRGWLVLGIEYVDSIERNNKATVEIEKVCHALADEVRVKMVEIIRNENEINVASLAKILNLPISATAYHLDVLKKAGILCYRMEGRVAFYWLNNILLKLAGQKIQQLGEE